MVLIVMKGRPGTAFVWASRFVRRALNNSSKRLFSGVFVNCVFASCTQGASSTWALSRSALVSASTPLSDATSFLLSANSVTECRYWSAKPTKNSITVTAPAIIAALTWGLKDLTVCENDCFGATVGADISLESSASPTSGMQQRGQFTMPEIENLSLHFGQIFMSLEMDWL